MIDGGSEPEEKEELKKRGIVFFACKKDEIIIAEASLWIEDGRITLHTNASLKEYQHLQPNNLLYWECIKWAKAKGYKELDLGGWQQNSFDNHLTGINKFKEKFGKVVFYEKDYPLLQALGRKAIKRSKLLWNINKKLRGRK
jgi:lipid II:glycine glycyltransferase (peptidoglycan interpeptide bridge formation enzyme)